MERQNTSIYQRTCAYIVSCQCTRIMPQLVPLEVRAFPSHFYCDFIAPASWDPAFLTFLENEVHRALRKEYTMKVVSMMRENAGAFLQEKRMNFLQEQVLSSPSSIVELISIDSTYELVEGSILNELDSAPHVIFYDFCHFYSKYPKIGGFDVLRIMGSACGYSKEASRQKRLFKQVKENDPVQFAKELEIFCFEGEFRESPIWLDKGIEIKNTFDAIFQKLCIDFGFKRVAAPLKNLYENFSFLANTYKDTTRFIQLCDSEFYTYNKDCSGLFATLKAYGDKFCVFCDKSELICDLTSLLNFIKKVNSMYGLELKWIRKPFKEQREFKGLSNAINEACEQAQIAFEENESVDYCPSSTIEVIATDGYGCIYPISCIDIRREQREDSEKIVLSGSVVISLERVLGLILEKHQGYLPIALSPVQGRILVVGSDGRNWALQVLKTCRDKGIRLEIDEREDISLSCKIYESQRAKIPVSYIIGKKEAENQCVMLRLNDEALKKFLVEKAMDLEEVVALFEMRAEK